MRSLAARGQAELGARLELGGVVPVQRFAAHRVVRRSLHAQQVRLSPGGNRQRQGRARVHLRHANAGALVDLHRRRARALARARHGTHQAAPHVPAFVLGRGGGAVVWR